MIVLTSANAARSRPGSATGIQPSISRTPPARAAAWESSADAARGAPKPSPSATVIPGRMRSASLVSREAKDALGDLGADDLGRPARDGQASAEQQGVLDGGVPVERELGAADSREQFGHPLLVLARQELGEATFRARVRAGHGEGGGADAEQPHRLLLRYLAPQVTEQAAVGFFGVTTGTQRGYREGRRAELHFAGA